jgi:ASC-1-like (ASCH) protein
MEHRLKTWPVCFADVKHGAKTFEIRKNDRDFKVGDFLILEEFYPETGSFTGERIKVLVTYTICLDGIPGMPNGFIGMSIEHQPPADEAPPTEEK